MHGRLWHRHESPDLSNLNLAEWSDFIGSRSNPYDDHGHGTMMAGILVADGELTGLAVDVNLYVAKALSGSGQEMMQLLLKRLTGVSRKM